MTLNPSIGLGSRSSTRPRSRISIPIQSRLRKKERKHTPRFFLVNCLRWKSSAKKLFFLIRNESDLTYTIWTLDAFGEAGKITACLGDRSSNDVGGEESQHANEEVELHGDCSMYKQYRSLSGVSEWWQDEEKNQLPGDRRRGVMYSLR